MKRWCALLAMLVMTTAKAFVFVDPTNLVQNTIAAQNSVQNLLRQAEIIRMQAQNLLSIGKFDVRNLASLMQQIDSLTQQGQSLSYNMRNLDQRFAELFPDYSNQTAPVDYQSAYKSWNKTSLTTMKNSLQGIGVTLDQLKQEEQLLERLKSQGQSATGRLQVLQVSNEVAIENVKQMQTLKRLVGLQANAQTAFMAQQVSANSQRDREVERLIDSMPTTVEPYHENPNFGLIKVPS